MFLLIFLHNASGKKQRIDKYEKKSPLCKMAFVFKENFHKLISLKDSKLTN